ncbi:MAG TPA: hypothetical protein VN803_08440 [Gemmatimonadales bacterium]|nr:hypothetical protein [Gemmatimonadales bacterium]
MVARSLALIMLTLTTLAGAQQPGPQMPDPQAMQMQVQRIAQERPREAEAAARGWLLNVVPELIPVLDSLKSASLDQYWMEVAQLTVQFDVFQNIWRRDSVRAQLVGKMFGLEAQARAQQRAYKTAPESARPAIRGRIEALITQHFDLEDQLRALEVADIERRLADVRAETTRRRERRSEFIKWAVDDIVRDAMRPK